MAAGTPVMTSKWGAMAEVAGDAALLVDPLDERAMTQGMHRLVDDGTLVRTLTERGRHNLARWSGARTADLTCDLYQRILDGGFST
jgi:glycosyltransferase involved in cell wall biosynthesis